MKAWHSCIFLLSVSCTVDTHGTFTGGTGGNPSSSSSTGGMGGGGSANTTGGGGNTSSTGGSGGDAGSSSSGGMAGTGGTGGASSGNCDPGLTGPSSVSASGVTQTSAYLRDHVGTEQYSNLTPAQISLTDKPYPAELVLAGLNGLSINFTGGSAKLYSLSAVTPSCGGANFYSLSCLQEVAHWFRCYHGSNESGCAGTLDIFTLVGDQSDYSSSTQGDQMVVASLVCQ